MYTHTHTHTHDDPLPRRLLCLPATRIASFRTLKAHPFFAGVGWEALLDCPPPFLPALEGEMDTSYFDDFSAGGPQRQDAQYQAWSSAMPSCCGTRPRRPRAPRSLPALPLCTARTELGLLLLLLCWSWGWGWNWAGAGLGWAYPMSFIETLHRISRVNSHPLHRNRTHRHTAMKVLVPVKRVIDYAVKIRVLPGGKGVDLNVKVRGAGIHGRSSSLSLSSMLTHPPSSTLFLNSHSTR
jgi:hypothetical protein